MGNPAEETCCHPNIERLRNRSEFVNSGIAVKRVGFMHPRIKRSKF